VSTSPGTITITHGTTLIKSWAISATAPVSETWSGRIHSKIAPGNYVVTASFANADTTVASETAAVGVSRKRLVKLHWKKKVNAIPATIGHTANIIPGTAEVLLPVSSPSAHKTAKERNYSSKVAAFDPTLEDAEMVTALPRAVNNSVKATEFVTTSRVRLRNPSSGKKKLYLAACGLGRDEIGFDVCGKAKSISTSVSATSPKTALYPGVGDAVWIVSLIPDNIAIIHTFTVHVTYYTLK
jgi:hypothetical protein